MRIVLDIVSIEIDCVLGTIFQKWVYRRKYRTEGGQPVKEATPMSFKQFVAWCNDRASDGCWGMTTAVICIDIISQMRNTPFWKRKKRWETEFNFNNALYKDVVKPTEERIEEFFSQEDL
jgi:hypothetical protein